MRSSLRICSSFFCLFLTLSPLGVSLQAQGTTGHLEGRVLSEEGSSVQGASVLIEGGTLPRGRVVLTDEIGYFRARDLPVGRYSVRVSGLGYRSVVVRDVAVSLERTTLVPDLVLAVQPEDLAPLEIRAPRLFIDPASSAVHYSADSRQLSLLPLSRDYLEWVPQLPHANRSYLGDGVNVGGATGLENVYLVDGINVTDPLIGSRGPVLPSSFVEEVTVRTGALVAESPGTLGGVINAVTRSGAERWEGEIQLSALPRAFQAEPRTAEVDVSSENPASLHGGLSLGGPLFTDDLRLFAAYELMLRKRDVAMADLAPRSDRRTAHRFAAKLSWLPSPGTSVSASVLGDPSERERVGSDIRPLPTRLENPDPLLLRTKEGTMAGSLTLRTRPLDPFLVETHLGVMRSRRLEGPATSRGHEEPIFIDLPASTWSGGPGIDRNDIRGTRWAGGIRVAAQLGRHFLTTGLEYEETWVDLLSRTTAPGAIVKVNDETFFLVRLLQDYEVKSRVPGAFLQDSWQATDRLLLNAGLRWNAEYLLGAGDSVAQGIPHEFQPRLGFVYLAGKRGTQRIFGSYGRYYQRLPLSFSTQAHTLFEECQVFFDEDPRNTEATPLFEQCFGPTESPLAEKLDGIRGEHTDEVTLGYERVLGSSFQLTLRGIYRELRAAYGFGFADGRFVAGNLGKGELSFLPEATRRYRALEATGRWEGEDTSILASYVLSRSDGNYTGLFSSDVGRFTPGNNHGLQVEEQARNSFGLLPNDRPHVFKLTASQRFDFGLTAGGFVTWQSGTPLNEFGASSLILRPAFLVPRGSAGRMSSIWDLDLRLAYPLSAAFPGTDGRAIVDIYHAGNSRTVVHRDQTRYRARDADGNQTLENPAFGAPLAFQPPLSVRLGLEVVF